MRFGKFLVLLFSLFVIKILKYGNKCKPLNIGNNKSLIETYKIM